MVEVETEAVLVPVVLVLVVLVLVEQAFARWFCVGPAMRQRVLSSRDARAIRAINPSSTCGPRSKQRAADVCWSRCRQV